MAQVSVRVKFDKTVEITCNGSNASDCLDDIADRELLNDYIFDWTNEAMEVVEGSYDPVEPDDPPDDDEDDSGLAEDIDNK